MAGKLLINAALILALVTLAYWLLAGANRGWTKTQVQVKTLDEVTGIDQIRWERRFSPGLDFLVAGLAGAVVLGGVSLLFRKPKKSTMASKSKNQTEFQISNPS